LTHHIVPFAMVWCGCENVEAHYTILGLHSNLRKECRVAEGLEPETDIAGKDGKSGKLVAIAVLTHLAPETISNESVTESDSEFHTTRG
jgi:hypothetical protein